MFFSFLLSFISPALAATRPADFQPDTRPMIKRDNTPSVHLEVIWPNNTLLFDGTTHWWSDEPWAWNPLNWFVPVDASADIPSPVTVAFYPTQYDWRSQDVTASVTCTGGYTPSAVNNATFTMAPTAPYVTTPTSPGGAYFTCAPTLGAA